VGLDAVLWRVTRPDSTPHFGPASRLHVAVFDEAALTHTAAGFGAAKGLQVWVADEPALARPSARGGPAMRLLIGILDKPALAAGAPCRRALALHAGATGCLCIFVADKATLRNPAPALSAAARLQIAISDEAALRFAATVHRPAIGLAVRIFDEATLAGLGPSAWGHACPHQPLHPEPSHVFVHGK